MTENNPEPVPVSFVMKNNIQFFTKQIAIIILEIKHEAFVEALKITIAALKSNLGWKTKLE